MARTFTIVGALSLALCFADVARPSAGPPRAPALIRIDFSAALVHLRARLAGAAAAALAARLKAGRRRASVEIADAGSIVVAAENPPDLRGLALDLENALAVEVAVQEEGAP